tara:strand:- start:332 stop:1576 length:1245 start_codon:yes stop_codon:yes gene_type:complete
MGVPSNLGRFAVREQSAWGTEQTSFSNAHFVECSMSVPTPVQESIQADVMRADHFATTRVAGGKGPVEISLSMPLHGFSTASPSGNPSEHPDALLLKSVLGSAEQGGYHASDLTGGTAAAITLTNGTGVVTDVGRALLVPLASGYSVGWVDELDESVSPDSYGLIRDLSAAPHSSGAIYGSNSIVLDKTQPTPFTLQFLGSTSNVSFRYSDAVVTAATISLNAREQPTLEVTIRAANWTNVGGEGGGAPSAEALADRPQLPVVLGDNGARVVNSSGALACGQLSISMAAEVVDEVNFSGQGISRLVVTKRTVEVTTVTPATSGDPTAGALDNPAALGAPGTSVGAIQVDANTTPGRSFSALVANGQLKELQALGDSGGIVAVTTVVEPALYTSDTTDTGSVSSPGNTPFRVAFL